MPPCRRWLSPRNLCALIHNSVELVLVDRCLALTIFIAAGICYDLHVPGTPILMICPTQEVDGALGLGLGLCPTQEVDGACVPRNLCGAFLL